MLVLGLTGGSGCGKGFVSGLLSKRGIPCIDCDVVSRKVCEKGSLCLSEIVRALGKEVLNENGEYDRAATAKIVFSNPDQLAALNRITHRHILACCREWLEKQRTLGVQIAVIDAPLLYESGFDAECDSVIAVIAEDGIRVRRILMRDGISKEMARARISNQKTNDFYRQHADYVIENNGENSEEAIGARLDEILADIERMEGGRK